jgi:hypothetical protein
MEQTTLQQRIEERAKTRLLKDLLDASNKEKEIAQQFGSDNFTPQLDVYFYYPTYGNGYIKLKNEFAQSLFEKLTPTYIKIVTDEILQKIDDIDYLLEKDKQAEF